MSWNFLATWVSYLFVFPNRCGSGLVELLAVWFVFLWAGENILRSSFELLRFSLGKLTLPN